MFQSAPEEREQDRDQKSLWQKLCPAYGSLSLHPAPAWFGIHICLPAKAAAKHPVVGAPCLIPAGEEEGQTLHERKREHGEKRRKQRRGRQQSQL